MLSAHQFHELAGQLRKTGGFTIDTKTGTQPSSGVSVAVPGQEHIVVNATGGAIAGYIGQHHEALALPGAHLGGWEGGVLPGPPGPMEGGSKIEHYDRVARTLNPHQMNVRHEDYLDVSEVIPEHPQGWHMADVHSRMHVNRQLAAYDLGRGAEIQNPMAPPGGYPKEPQPDEYGSTVSFVRRMKRGA